MTNAHGQKTTDRVAPVARSRLRGRTLPGNGSRMYGLEQAVFTLAVSWPGTQSRAVSGS